LGNIQNYLNLLEAETVFLIYEEEVVKHIAEFGVENVVYLHKDMLGGKGAILESSWKIYKILLELKIASTCSAFVGEADSEYSWLIFQWMCLLNGNCMHYLVNGPEWKV